MSPGAEPLVLVPNGAMRARRCPGAVATTWALDAALGTVLAWPLGAIARAAYGTHPRADAVLWDAGGLPLLDLLVRTLPSMGALAAQVVAVTFGALALGLLPSAALLVCIAFARPDARTPGMGRALPLALTAFGPFAALSLTTLVLQGSLVAAAVTAATLADEAFRPRHGEWFADAVALIVLVAGLSAVALAGVVQDAARAAIVRFELDAASGLRRALTTATRTPIKLLWSWAWRATAAIVPLAFGALLADRVGGRGGVGLAALFVIHQAIIGVRSALRASWMACAMRFVDATPQ